MYIALFGLLFTALFAHWTKQWLRDNVVLPTSYRLNEMTWNPPVPYRAPTNDYQVWATSSYSLTASYPYPIEYRR